MEEALLAEDTNMITPSFRLARFGVVALVGLMTLAACQSVPERTRPDLDAFETDLRALREYFHIPGMAVLVKKGGVVVHESYLGYADLENEIPVDANTSFPVASVTKIVATVLVMQLIEEDALSLEDPLTKFYPDQGISENIRLEHILSHSAQGTPGDGFLYSGRLFAAGTRVIEQAGGGDFATLLRERVLESAGMTDSLLFDSEEVADAPGNRIARPYSFRGAVEPGHYEPGYSTSAGLISTVRDLAKFDDALDGDTLISAELRERMASPYVSNRGDALPYGYGVFVQSFLGEKIVWGYGQHDCFSSLYLKVPGRDLTLLMLANNNLMSDPPRLINGDVTYSLFALNFLKHFVYALPRNLSFADYRSSADIAGEIQPLASTELRAFYRQELLARAIAAGFLGRVDDAEAERSGGLLGIVFELYPEWQAYANLTLLHALGTSIELGEADALHPHMEAIGSAILERDPENPYANEHLGAYYDARGLPDKAAPYYRTILEAENYQRFWYTQEAESFFSRQ